MKYIVKRNLFGIPVLTCTTKGVSSKSIDNIYYTPFVDRTTKRIGFIHKKTGQIIPAQFTSFDTVHSNTIVTELDGKYGTISSQGIKAPNIYDTYTVKKQGIIVSKVDSADRRSKMGLLDLYTGRVLLDPIYQEVRLVVIGDGNLEKYLATHFDGDSELIGSVNGEVLAPKGFKKVIECDFGGKKCYLATMDTYSTLTERCGKVLISAPGVMTVRAGCIAVCQDETTTTVYQSDKPEPSKILYKPAKLEFFDSKKGPYGKVQYIFKEYCADGKVFLIDDNNTTLSRQFDDIQTLDSDYYTYEQDGGLGFMSRKLFTPITLPEYDAITPLHGRSNFAKKNGLWGALNPQLQEVVPFEFHADKISARQQILFGTTQDGQRDVTIELGGRHPNITYFDQDVDYSKQPPQTVAIDLKQPKSEDSAQ